MQSNCSSYVLALVSSFVPPLSPVRFYPAPSVFLFMYAVSFLFPFFPGSGDLSVKKAVFALFFAPLLSLSFYSYSCCLFSKFNCPSLFFAPLLSLSFYSCSVCVISCVSSSSHQVTCKEKSLLLYSKSKHEANSWLRDIEKAIRFVWEI